MLMPSSVYTYTDDDLSSVLVSGADLFSRCFVHSRFYNFMIAKTYNEHTNHTVEHSACSVQFNISIILIVATKMDGYQSVATVCIILNEKATKDKLLTRDPIFWNPSFRRQAWQTGWQVNN